MATECMVRVVVDAVGGDLGHETVLAGVSAAIASDDGVHVLLAGPAEVVEVYAARHRPQVEPLVAPEVIAMDEAPAAAVRSKRNSSIVVGCRAVGEGSADAFFSAGNTGAVMAAATLVMGRLEGVDRPALAALLPFGRTPLVFLDVGAQADCGPENLLQFAHMGAAYAKCALGVAEPRAALLNIGGEPTKGSRLAQEAHTLLSGASLAFLGNIEGRDLMSGSADVVVTDGFTGNVCLKLLEGSAAWLLGEVRTSVTSTPARKVAATALRPALSELRSRLDPEAYGGVPLLGVRGACVIGHGNSSPTGIAAGVLAAARTARGGLTEAIVAALQPGSASPK